MFNFICFRNLEDFITWVDTSAIKKHIMEYNDEVSSKVYILMLGLLLILYYFFLQAQTITLVLD